MNMYDAKGGYLGSTEVTHIYRGRFHACRRKGQPHRSAETSSRLQMASSVDGGVSIVRTLQADAAPHNAFRELPEDNFRFTVAHADTGLFEARKEGYLRRPADDHLISTEGRLRPTEDLRQADDVLI